MNTLLSEKKFIEVRIDTINQQDDRFRLVTRYNEMDDSLTLNPQYLHQELVDSIHYLKIEKEFLNDKLEKIKYSIDSLEKLK